MRARLLPKGREAVALACATAIASRWELSPKRAEIVVGILLGESTTEIAERAAIAPSTVKTHIRAILQQTGRQNKLGVVALLFDILRAAIEVPSDDG